MSRKKWTVSSLFIETGIENSVPVLLTWGVQVVRYPNFFSGMEADRNVKVVGGDVAAL